MRQELPRGALSNAHIITTETPTIRTSLRALIPKLLTYRRRRRSGRLELAGGKESRAPAV